MTHKFKVGSEWITRGGWKAVVVEDDESSLPFLVDHGDGERRWHFPDGDCQNEDSDFGLIAPWEEPAPSARDGVPMSDALSPAELENARHALGLPNKAKRSYRNRYVCPEDDELWQGLVARGLAKFRAAKSLPFGGDAMFWLTRAGAAAALKPGERLCPHDFPQEATND